jgi:hypothetical protein
MTKTPSFRLAAFVPLALASGSALAQTGSLSYGPDSAVPVPLGSPLALAILAVILAGLAAWRLRRHPILRVFAVAVPALLAGLSQLPPNVHAVAISLIQLDDPQGGTVDVPTGPQRFVNETPIAQRITALTPPCVNSIQLADSVCEAGGTLLASGQSCDTDFRCPAVTEICDGLDNDFNGLIDDGVTEPEASCPDGQSWACTGIGGWVCQGSTPDCSGKVCGDDGAGGSCGSCSAGQICDGSGLCVPAT